MRKALLIGDRELADLHPLTGMQEAFGEVLRGLCEISTADEGVYGGLTCSELRAYDLVIFMPEKWRRTATKTLTAALVTYVVHGGRLLATHHGLIADNTPELSLLYAARYRDHAPYGALDYHPAAGSPLAEGLRPITVSDEPYRFDFDVFKQTDVVMELEYGNTRHPALWRHGWGKGRVACMAPGHSADSVMALAEPLRRVAGWLLDEGGTPQ